MNKQTLSYHTRLHDWYRSHCIQQEKQQQHPPNYHHHHGGGTVAALTPAAVAGTGKAPVNHAARGVNDTVLSGTLTTDKMYSIDEWCSDVNRSLFCIKKKEASPLFRKCRLSASTKSSMGANNNNTNKTADPRRIKSAEVFTRTGHWAKQHKPVVRGGELLPKQRGASERGVRVVSRHGIGGCSTDDSNYNNRKQPEFCVRNSKESSNLKANQEDTATSFPRVNHDSLNVRTNVMVGQQSNKHHSEKNVDKSVVLSSQFIPEALASSTAGKSPSDVGKSQKVKTVTVNYVVNNLVKESNERGNTSPSHHSDLERAKNTKNFEESKKNNNRIFSASQKSVKTEINSSALGGDDETKAALNAVVRFCEQDTVPTFCNECSGIYSGNAPPPPTPATCANCVHGISLHGKSDLHVQESLNHGPSHAEIQKELAQKLVRNEKAYSERVTSAKIDLKMSETRLTEDSIHYSAEREKFRNADAKPGFSLPNTFDDLGDERNISFQDDDDCSQSLSNGRFSGSSASTSSVRGDDSRNPSIERGERSSEKHVQTEILIQTYSPVDSKRGTPQKMDGVDISPQNSQDLNAAEDTNNLQIQRHRRGSRRLSLSYTYKPEVSSISTSNNLLRVLSIDDCKMGMRYNPHKVLEEHQVIDDPMPEMVKRAMGKFGSDLDDIEKDSQVAMRLSQSQDSFVTSLHSSSANNATIANKMQYKILFGPEDLNHYKNLRPKSACLTKAFQTMIHDRTVMQRIDRRGSTDKARNACGIARTTEGPKYKIINTALKREMGNMMQMQRQKLLRKYEQQKNGLVINGDKSRTRSSSRLSGSTMEKSLSLDSLPSVKKGILKNTD